MTSDLLKRITINPDVLFGKPSIRNMRYSVAMILDLLSAGMTTEEILEDYPDLELKDILAHFPKRLATWLINHGEDAIHTSDLPEKNNTSDKTIIQFGL